MARRAASKSSPVRRHLSGVVEAAASRPIIEEAITLAQRSLAIRLAEATNCFGGARACPLSRQTLQGNADRGGAVRA
jgi:hypothetical protein